jgi:hypothetical protein
VSESPVEAWCALDHAVAFSRADHEAIEATRGPRALVVERMQAPGADLFHACAMLGRQLAELGGTPSLAARTMDSAFTAVASLDARTAGAARAALLEGFVAARTEGATSNADARWEYPGCAVPLEEALVAIAAGFPEEDEDTLVAWAARVASAVARGGFRRAVIAGGAKACAALVDALELAGVKVRTTAPPAPLGAERPGTR